MESHNVARTREGHAALAGTADRWVIIQENTFKNWVNEQLRTTGQEVDDLVADFENGIKLCALIQALQGKRLRVISNTQNHHQKLANVSNALTAIANDNIRLVNIGPEDIVNGNLKLILGLIWHLILRYQIGKSKFPTKKLMIAWLRAVIPECDIQNFTSDWNDGVALHALIDFCKPGLCPNWKHLSRSEGLNNCRDAMMLAKQHFDIPLVVRPEDLSSSDLDELSGMTYLSYFMKLDSPGYNVTLNLVRHLLKPGVVNNFTSDWSDGQLLCKLVHSVGGHIPGWPALSGDPVHKMQLGLDGARGLGIEPLLPARDMVDPEVDHIAIMAYAAYFLKFKPVKTAAEKIVFTSLPQNVSVKQKTSFEIRFEDDDITKENIKAEVVGPDLEKHVVHINWVSSTGQGSFTPTETGIHKLNVYCDGKLVKGCPASFKVLADRSKVTFSPVESCSLGTFIELQVNGSSAGEGHVQFQVCSPSGHTSNLNVIPKPGGYYVTNFNPTEIGDWEVSVKFDNENIPGSPYKINVFDPTLVKVYGLEGGNLGSGISFNADATHAGKGKTRFEIKHNGTDVTKHCTPHEEKPGFYKIDFNAPAPGTYQVHAFFNNVEVRGSPYNLEIVDSNNITVSGEGLGLIPADRTATFEIHALSSSTAKVEVSITGPTGSKVPAKVERQATGSYTVNFLPVVAGEHKVTVLYGGQKIRGSPYTVRVYDANKVTVSNMPHTSIMGQPVVFNIDASKAGSGNIEIMVNDGEIACSVQNHGNFKFTASFMPNSTDEHVIQMKFNGQQVPGSPWQVAILDPGKVLVTGSGLEFVHVDKTASFSVNMLHMDSKKMSVKIIAPNGSTVPHTIQKGNGDLKVEYVPKDVGDHKIEIKYADTIVNGSPFIAKAYNTAAIKVTPLPNGVVGQKIEFGIDVTKAGEGQLEIMVNNGDLPNTVDSDELCVYRISFVPVAAGTHTVDIVFNKVNLPDSPLTCNVINLSAASVRNLEHHHAVGKTASFYVHSENLGEDLNVSVDVLSPSGDRMNADVYRQSNGEYKVEWMPWMAGRHTVDLQLGGRQIDGSPFYVDVFDLSSIKVDNLKHGKVGDKAVFTVDFSKAGTLSLEVEIVSPSGVAVMYDIHDLRHMCKEYIYEPDKPGKYQIYIKYGGFQLPACPYTQSISDGGMPSASGNGLFFAEEDKPAHFNVMVGQRKGDLRVAVSGPHSIAKCSVDPQSDGSYDVTYIPVETGIFDISVTWNSEDIPGSPYHPKVIDARKVRIIGGWHHFMDNHEKVNLIVGEHKQLPFDTSEAGPGTLKAEVKGPSHSLDVDIDTHTKGKSVVDFVPEEEGTHYIYILWCDVPLTNSPFIGFAIHQKPDASKLILTGRGLKEAIVREEAEFLIDGSQANKGKPEVVLSGVRAEINVQVSALGNGKFRCSYIPTIPGAYLLHITWNGLQLRGSPYKVNVLATSYPNRVLVLGEGLKGGILGRAMDVTIDTRRAGPGELSAHCMGPHQVAYCELEDNRDGTFRLSIKPQEQGRHLLQVKYSGEHVQGSPYVLKVASQPDASKVRVHGPGVEHGILATYVSQFHVETKGAGSGQLTVRIRGPKGAFQVEMYRDSQRDRTILCKYDPVECGLYFISVKWSDVDVPGSPFQVYILDTQDELEQVLKESSFPNGTNQSRANSQRSSQPSQRMSYGQWQQLLQ